jgi:hypothetical protein
MDDAARGVGRTSSASKPTDPALDGATTDAGAPLSGSIRKAATRLVIALGEVRGINPSLFSSGAVSTRRAALPLLGIALLFLVLAPASGH